MVENKCGKKTLMLKNGKSAKIGKTLFYIVMMAFPVIHFLIFYVYVNLNSFFLGFKEYIIEQDQLTWSWSLMHFKTIFYEITQYPQNILFGYMLKNSLKAFFVEIIVVIPTSMVFSFYIYKKLPLANVFKVLLFVPSIISVLALSIVYNSIANNVVPYIFGCDKLLLQLYPERTFWALIVFGLLISYGVNILMYVSTMSGIDNSLVEAAKIDGAGMFKEFINITLPACYSTISVFIVMSIVNIFVNQINSHAFFGANLDESLYTFGYFLLIGTLNAGTSITQYGYLSAWGLCFSVIAIPLTFGVRWLLNKVGPSED